MNVRADKLIWVYSIQKGLKLCIINTKWISVLSTLYIQPKPLPPKNMDTAIFYIDSTNDIKSTQENGPVLIKIQ